MTDFIWAVSVRVLEMLPGVLLFNIGFATPQIIKVVRNWTAWRSDICDAPKSHPENHNG